MRTLHTGETYQHENGSVIEIVAPVYKSLTKPPVRYRVKKVGGEKVFVYEKQEIKELILDGKLKRVY